MGVFVSIDRVIVVLACFSPSANKGKDRSKDKRWVEFSISPPTFVGSIHLMLVALKNGDTKFVMRLWTKKPRNITIANSHTLTHSVPTQTPRQDTSIALALPATSTSTSQSTVISYTCLSQSSYHKQGRPTSTKLKQPNQPTNQNSSHGL